MELKRRTSRKMVKTKLPKQFWDHCLELEAMVRSNTAHCIFELDVEVPQSAVFGDTPDISLFCDFGWYDWLYFRDTVTNFPNDKMMLGRYLGPSVYDEPAMSVNVL